MRMKHFQIDCNWRNNRWSLSREHWNWRLSENVVIIKMKNGE